MKLGTKLLITLIMAVNILFLLNRNSGQVQAIQNTNHLKEQLEYYTRNIDTNNITKENILEVYDEISQQYSPETIANLLEEKAKEIEEQGISKEIITAGANFIRETDTESIRKIIEEDIDIEEVKQKVSEGYTVEQILSNIVQETPTEKKIEIVTKLLLANKIIKIVIMVVVILFIYGTILRWIIYVKADKPGVASIIPFYRQIVMYQICGLSPWLMLLWFVPIIGWLAMFIVAIIKRICLAKVFGRGALFGWGLVIIPPVFQSILAFHPQITKQREV